METVDLFNRQERQHHRLHGDLMEMLVSKKYLRLCEYEAAFDADLKNLLAMKTLAWKLAYCEGFESAGCAPAEAWIDGGSKAICGDHGSVPMNLWMWHMAEELEHRSIVHDVLHQLYGKDEAFALRKQGATINRQHNSEHALAAAVYITQIDQAHMTAKEIESSNGRAFEARQCRCRTLRHCISVDLRSSVRPVRGRSPARLRIGAQKLPARRRSVRRSTSIRTTAESTAVQITFSSFFAMPDRTVWRNSDDDI